MPPRKSVLSGRVGKKRKASISVQLSDLKLISSSPKQHDVPADTIDNTPQIRTVYHIKAKMLAMRAKSPHTACVTDHKGYTYSVSDHSISSFQLQALIAELEEQIRNLTTRLRYHKSRFPMTTRSQRRWSKLVGMQRYDSHFMLTHQKELQDGEDLLECLKEEAAHVRLLEGSDDRFEKKDSTFKEKTRKRSVSV